MQPFHLKGRALLVILLILLNQGNHGFPGPKSDLDLLNNRKRSRLIAKQIYMI